MKNTKVKFELIGKVKATNDINYMGEESVYKDEKGILYLQTKGQFTSTGVENWFVPVSNYQLKDDFIYLEQKNPNVPWKGILKLKNSQVDLSGREFPGTRNDLQLLNAKEVFGKWEDFED